MHAARLDTNLRTLLVGPIATAQFAALAHSGHESFKKSLPEYCLVSWRESRGSAVAWNFVVRKGGTMTAVVGFRVPSCVPFFFFFVGDGLETSTLASEASTFLLDIV